MSEFGYPDRFTDTLSGGPQFTPLYSNQNTKPISESENKEIKAQRDELLDALEGVIDAWQYGSSIEEANEVYTKAKEAIAKAKGE